MGKISVKPWHSQPTTRVNRHFSLGPQQCRLNRVILYIRHNGYNALIDREWSEMIFLKILMDIFRDIGNILFYLLQSS